jgi:hypothetical protein
LAPALGHGVRHVPLYAALKVASWCHPKEVHMYAAPERTVEQRRAALDYANEVRLARAAWKRDVKAGRVDAVAMIVSPAPAFESMKIGDVLRAVPKYGRVKVNRVLARTRISPAKTLGGLSARQRAELVALMERSSGAST